MKIKLTLASLFFAAAAHAQQAPPGAVEKMMAQSEFYMNCGVCQVERRPFALTAQTLLLPPPAGVRQISASDYNWIKEAGSAKGASGLYVMTERVQQACLTWSSDTCLVVRALWRQEWPTGQCISPTDGKVYVARQQ